jgi:hypothetical protein
VHFCVSRVRSCLLHNNKFDHESSNNETGVELIVRARLEGSCVGLYFNVHRIDANVFLN